VLNGFELQDLNYRKIPVEKYTCSENFGCSVHLRK